MRTCSAATRVFAALGAARRRATPQAFRHESSVDRGCGQLPVKTWMRLRGFHGYARQFSLPNVRHARVPGGRWRGVLDPGLCAGRGIGR
jgi:hypothetical protein